MRTLTPSILVRIQVPQPHNLIWLGNERTSALRHDTVEFDQPERLSMAETCVRLTALKAPHHRLTDFHLKIGCTANCLHPGFVATRFGDQSGGVISRFVGLASKSLRIEVSRFADMVGRPRIQQKGVSPCFASQHGRT
jgi:hypothetical protein